MEISSPASIWPGTRGRERTVFGVIFDKARNLYGTAFGGGEQLCAPLGCGVVYKLAPATNGKWKETIVHLFYGAEGENSLGRVVFYATGNLYGTTDYGGNRTA